MTRIKILGAAAILASALAGPAMAQPVISNPGTCAELYPNANCLNAGQGNPYTGNTRRQAYRQNGNWQNSYNRWDNRGSFGPGYVAAGAVGGAVGTATAFATAPIGGDEYARRNGFVCTPGTLFRGEDGRMHPCQ